MRKEGSRAESQETLFAPTLRRWETSGKYTCRCTHYSTNPYSPCTTHMGRHNHTAHTFKSSYHNTNSPNFATKKRYGWKAHTLPSKLGKNHQGSLGTRDSFGIQNPFFTHTPAVLSLPLAHLKRGESLHRDRNSVSSSGWGYQGIPEYPSRGLLLDPIHSSKERRWPPAYNQPQVSKCLYTSSSFQDGGTVYCPGHHLPGGLYVQTRSEGCIFYGPGSRRASEVPVIPMEEEVLPLHLSSLWPLGSTLDFHKGHPSCCPVSQSPRCENGGLPGRHAFPAPGERGAVKDQRCSSGSSRELGVSCKLQEVGTLSSTKDQLPGIYDRLPRNEDQPPLSEGGFHSERSQEISHHPPNLSTPIGPHDRCILLHNSSDTSSSAALPRTTIPETPGTQSRWILSHSDPVRGGQERSELVDLQPGQDEWSAHSSGSANSDNHNRCLQLRLGSTLPEGQNRRSVVSGGEIPPHKLPRAFGSFSGCQIILQRQRGPNSSSQDGQLSCNSICESPRRDKIISPLLPGNRTMGLVPGKEDISGRISPPRNPEHNGRQPFQICGGQTRLDSAQNSVQEAELIVGTHSSGSLCNENIQTTSQIFQLETRPSCRSNRRLCSTLDRLQGLCQPPLVLDREVYPAHQETESVNHSDNSSLAISTMVCCTSLSVSRSTENSPSLEEPHEPSTRVRTPIPRATPPNGRLACLRRHYQASGMSESATRLLLSSWRPSTNKNYDSAWNTWERWCSEHHRDPVSPSVGAVVDLLADMFDEG